MTAAGFDSEKALIGGWTLEGADFQRVVESLSGNGSLSAAASGSGLGGEGPHDNRRAEARLRVKLPVSGPGTTGRHAQSERAGGMPLPPQRQCG